MDSLENPRTSMGKTLLNLPGLASWVIMSSQNWPAGNNYFIWQFNFPYYLFPAHTDGCGFLKPKLTGGEGFGHNIAVVQLKGTGNTWVFVMAEVPAEALD